MNELPESDRSAARSSVRFVTLILGVLISAFGVWLIVRAANPDRLSAAFSTIAPGWIVTGLGAIGLTFFTRTWRWAGLLHPLNLSTSSIMTALLSGQVVNFLLPLRLGDVVRSIMLGRQPNSSTARVFGSVVIEKGWDWLMLCLIVVLATVIAPLPDWFSAPARTVGLIAVLILVVFGLIAVAPDRWSSRISALTDRLFAWLPARILNSGHRLMESLTALRHQEAVVSATVWSVATWVLGVVANYAVLRAFGVASLSAALILIVVLMVGVALPPSIAAIGVFEGLTILTLSAFGVSIETGLAIGITLHVVIFVPPVLAAALLWWAART